MQLKDLIFITWAAGEVYLLPPNACTQVEVALYEPQVRSQLNLGNFGSTIVAAAAGASGSANAYKTAGRKPTDLDQMSKLAMKQCFHQIKGTKK